MKNINKIRLKNEKKNIGDIVFLVLWSGEILLSKSSHFQVDSEGESS